MNSEIFNIALKALSTNKIRTFLTMLGVIIGVFAVVTLVSLVRGVQNYVDDEFEKIGSNLIFIAPGRASFNQDPALSFTNNKLAEKHVDLINSFAQNEIVGASSMITAGKTIEYKSKKYFAVLSGGNESFFSILEIDAEKGREFTKNELRSGSRAVILGSDAKKELFGSQEALGKVVRIDSKSFEVVGVAESKGAEWDQQVYLPYTTLEDQLNISTYSNIIVKLKDSHDVDLGVKQVELALLHDLKKDEFTVMSSKQILTEVQGILSILSFGLGAVAAISLLVGGIGIMNIMLVSVTERTREVGLRKALGATSFNIGVQFIIESVLMSIAGGAVGLLFGFAATYFVQSLIRAEVPWWAVILAFGFSTVVGVVFGTYPAYKASKKDPIVALRFE